MTHFLTLADHYGTAVHVIGSALALFFVAMIGTEAVLRGRRQRRDEQRFNERKDAMLARLTREKRA